MRTNVQTLRAAVSAPFTDAADADDRNVQGTNWVETAVTIIATAVAVVFVAFIAVLMSLA